MQVKILSRRYSSSRRPIRREKDGVRLLSDGELKAKVAFEVAGASRPAVEKIEKAGGSVKLLAAAAAAE